MDINSSSKLFTQRGLYLQFPLSLLAYPGTDAERWEAVIDYGCRVVGLSLEDRGQLEGHLVAPVPRGFDRRNRRQCVLVAGAKALGIRPHDLAQPLMRLESIDQFLDRFAQAAPGEDATVRLKKDLVFEARDRKGLLDSHLIVLAAIVSVIGRRRCPVRITQKAIRCRAVGCRSLQVLAAARQAGVRLPEPLSDWAIRSALKRLYLGNLVHRFTFGRRITYYAIGMTRKDFQLSVHDHATRRQQREWLRQIEDDELDAAIRNRRAVIKWLPPPRPHATPLEGAGIDPELIDFGPA